MTPTEREEILRMYHKAYTQGEKPMREIEQETGMSSSTLRKRWRALGLPNFTDLHKRGSERFKEVYSNRSASYRGDDFQNIAPHQPVPGYDDPACVVCSQAH